MTAFDSHRCPFCGGDNMASGYGFAGGGLGGYTFCLDCDEMLVKHRDDPSDCFNGIVERAGGEPEGG